MKHYIREDFSRYYAGAFIIDPVTGVLGQLDSGRDGQFNISTADGRVIPVDYTALEWPHVRCPTLGYLHLDDGYRFYHSSKGPHDGTPKGLNPAVVAVVMPPETRAAFQRTKLKVPLLKPGLTAELAAAIAAPNFVTVPYAVDKLLNSPHAIGFALSRDAGLTLGLSKNELIVGLYRGRKACTSSDGQRFRSVGEWADGITKRHFSF